MNVIPAIRAVPPSHYLAYLLSGGWRARRNRALKDAGYRCSRCPSKRDLEVHHLTYERLGGERDSDLAVLCAGCHRAEHLEHPEQTSFGVYLRLASEAVANDPFLLIADLAEDVKVACVKHKIPVIPERINSALAVVCGNRLRTPERPEVPRTPGPGPLSREEAYQTCCRLWTFFGITTSARVIKEIR